MATELETAGLEGERRQVTVLFADLVGFTAFSERSGEEAAFVLMRRVAGMMTSVVAAGSGALSGGLFRGLAWQANIVLVKVGYAHRIRISVRAAALIMVQIVELPDNGVSRLRHLDKYRSG